MRIVRICLSVCNFVVRIVNFHTHDADAIIYIYIYIVYGRSPTTLVSFRVHDFEELYLWGKTENLEESHNCTERTSQMIRRFVKTDLSNISPHYECPISWSFPWSQYSDLSLSLKYFFNDFKMLSYEYEPDKICMAGLRQCFNVPVTSKAGDQWVSLTLTWKV